MLLHLNLTRFSVFSLTDKSLLFCFSPPVAVLLPRFRLPPTSAKYKSPSPSFCFRFVIFFSFLLQRGYTVRATIRDLSNPNKVDHLLKLDGAKERLQFFKADLLEEAINLIRNGCNKEHLAFQLVQAALRLTEGMETV
ncbi:hypothetical protein P8452_71339 [Trifolium repens]|nr:hypothetical protein P8452_71339 [Trifolium repens]